MAAHRHNLAEKAYRQEDPMQEPSAPAPDFFSSAPMALDRAEGWRYIRERGPVFEADGVWYATSFEAVRFVQTHPEIFSSAKGYTVGSPVPMIPLMIDPPDHARYRRILDPMLSPNIIRALEPYLREQAAALVDAFASEGSCDVVRDLAELFPTQVLLTLLGLPVADRDKFHGWAFALLSESAPEPTPTQAAAAAALFAYLQEHLEWKRTHQGDDMISRVLAISDEDAWTPAEVLGMCFLFVLAALDTTSGAIGFVFYHLAKSPTLRKEVVADPQKITAVVEEVLRLELPAPMIPRMTTEEVEVCGTTIPKGSRVMIVLGTANREAEDGGSRDELSLSDTARAHLTFGGGIHRCLGSHLARRELSLIVEEFHARIPEYEIETGIEPRISWPAATFHLESLPLVFTAN
jgi:cytochrome P450